TSIIVPVPKKGDMKDPDNYRGISLVPTIIKLLAKIVATKLIAKEQVSFRNFEECVAQATTLYEIARRRKIKNLQTWICFVDYSVDVPGIPNHIPGLLFADDAVVLANSAENLQTSLDAISAWSDAWEMAVNAFKCAIMAINCDDAAEMTLQRQTIRTADNYTYLGYIMNSKWDASGTIRNNKLKAQKALYSAYGFLNGSNVLTALKIKFINSTLLPIGCYGGEKFGMSEARCHPIQTVIDQATRLVAKVGKSAAMERIREELCQDLGSQRARKKVYKILDVEFKTGKT
ncbi:RNA-directed DNA polymerase from mobile element jockey, partial [Smittium culicis]